MPRIPVALSSASVYPQTTSSAFETAARLGYDGVEVMVWTDPVSQQAAALRGLSEHHEMPVVSVHAPTLLLTQRVWGPDAWTKVDRSIDLAHDVGAPVVVLHPPFRWQKEYARAFADGVAEREHDRDIVLAVENMYPWTARGRQVEAYLPHWDPVPQPYDHVTLDLSHTASAGSDALQMVRDLGPRLSHLHLADGSGETIRDEHLVPGRGGSRARRSSASSRRAASRGRSSSRSAPVVARSPSARAISPSPCASPGSTSARLVG